MILGKCYIVEGCIFHLTAVILIENLLALVVWVVHYLPALTLEMLGIIIEITDIKQLVTDTITHLVIYSTCTWSIIGITLVTQAVVVDVIMCIEEIVTLTGEVHTELSLVVNSGLTSLTILGLNQNNTTIGTGTIDSGRSGILQHLD